MDRFIQEWRAALTDPRIEALLTQAETVLGQTEEVPSYVRQLAEDLGFSVDAVRSARKEIESHLAPLKDILDGVDWWDFAVVQVMPSVKAKDAPEYDSRAVSDLINYLKLKYSAYTALQSGLNPTEVVVPREQILPPEKAESRGVDTAAITPTGEVIVNRAFLQRILNLAAYKKRYGDFDLGPLAKELKETLNIPEEYVVVAFVLRHEYRHWLRGDLTVLKYAAQEKDQRWFTAANIAEDILINNALRDEMGFSTAPIPGMFSRSRGYHVGDLTANLTEEIYRRLQQVDDDQIQQINQIQRVTSDSTHSEENVRNAPGCPSCERPGTGPVSREKAEERTPLERALEKQSEEIDREVQQGQTPEERIARQRRERPRISVRERGGEPGQSGTGFEESIELEGELKPQFPWNVLIKKLAARLPKTATEESYTRPSRSRMGLTETLLSSTGTGPVFPGELVLEGKEPILILFFDTSGSMGRVLPAQMNHIAKLLKQLKVKAVLTILGTQEARVGYFNSTTKKVQVYELISAQGKKVKAKEWGDYPLTKFLKSAELGGTLIPPVLKRWFKTLQYHPKAFIFFTDTDMLSQQNLAELNALIKLAKGRAGIIASDYEEYKAFREAVLSGDLKAKLENLSYLS